VRGPQAQVEGWRQQSQQWASWGPGSRTERLQQDPQEPSNLREELEAPRRWERQSARLSEELSEVRRRADEAKVELEKAKAGHSESEAAKVHLGGVSLASLFGVIVSRSTRGFAS
jgi:hypothetical protein